MKNLEKEIFKNDFIQKDKDMKEKLLKKIESLYMDASSLIDINKNIYSDNNKTLTNKPIEKILKEYINFNDLLQNKNNNLNCLNQQILKQYNSITEISISKTEDLNLKINLDFLDNNGEYYIIISHKDSVYNVVDISPQEINFEKYIDELNINQDFTLFLSRLINYEFIPYYKNHLK